jgi:hypothetical protein
MEWTLLFAVTMPTCTSEQPVTRSLVRNITSTTGTPITRYASQHWCGLQQFPCKHTLVMPDGSKTAVSHWLHPTHICMSCAQMRHFNMDSNASASRAETFPGLKYRLFVMLPSPVPVLTACAPRASTESQFPGESQVNLSKNAYLRPGVRTLQTAIFVAAASHPGPNTGIPASKTTLYHYRKKMLRTLRGFTRRNRHYHPRAKVTPWQPCRGIIAGCSLTF